MILRILGEGQFEVPDNAMGGLNRLDDALAAACASGDQAAFRQALVDLHQTVHDIGVSVPVDHLGPSELLLPADDATLDEVAAMLGEEGLIPD